LWKRTWFIVTAAVVALLVVGSISSAIAGGKKNVDAVAETTPIAATTPTEDPIPSEAPTPTEIPAAEVVDPTYFRATAGKQLDDYEKDLGDLTDAVSKGSVIRVASNSVELTFNDGQLSAITPTANVEAEWAAALAALSATTEQITDAGSKSDYTAVNSLIAQATAQVATLREILGRAA